MASNIPDLFGDEVPAEDHKGDVQDLGAGVCPRCESVALLVDQAWKRSPCQGGVVEQVAT